MTNQQLKAHCEDVIANPQDHQDWVVDMARVTLASLDAEPVAWVLNDKHRDASHVERNKKIVDLFSVFDGHEVTPLYTAPPLPELKPIECPSFDGYVPHIAKELQGAFKNAVIRAGYEVKS